MTTATLGHLRSQTHNRQRHRHTTVDNSQRSNTDCSPQRNHYQAKEAEKHDLQDAAVENGGLTVTVAAATAAIAAEAEAAVAVATAAAATTTGLKTTMTRPNKQIQQQ